MLTDSAGEDASPLVQSAFSNPQSNIDQESVKKAMSERLYDALENISWKELQRIVTAIDNHSSDNIVKIMLVMIQSTKLAPKLTDEMIDYFTAHQADLRDSIESMLAEFRRIEEEKPAAISHKTEYHDAENKPAAISPKREYHDELDFCFCGPWHFVGIPLVIALNLAIIYLCSCYWKWVSVCVCVWVWVWVWVGVHVRTNVHA